MVCWGHFIGGASSLLSGSSGEFEAPALDGAEAIDFFCLLTFALAAVLGTTMAFLGASTPLESVVAGVIAVGVFGGQPHFHLTSAGTALVSSDTGSVAVAVAFAVQMDHIVGIAREGERLGYAAV